jgi:regulator of protease activity HflC (stomatin/prohibitin superfamily)
MTNNRQITLGAVTIILLIITCAWGCPLYQVYSSGMHGKAELQRATYNRQIATQEAEAKEQAAIHLYSADTIRAHGIARSNEIIGQSLQKNEAYLKWLWIDELSKQQSVIYVPTECNMPLLLQGKKDSIKKDF